MQVGLRTREEPGLCFPQQGWRYVVDAGKGKRGERGVSRQYMLELSIYRHTLLASASSLFCASDGSNPRTAEPTRITAIAAHRQPHRESIRTGDTRARNRKITSICAHPSTDSQVQQDIWYVTICSPWLLAPMATGWWRWCQVLYAWGLAQHTQIDDGYHGENVWRLSSGHNASPTGWSSRW